MRQVPIMLWMIKESFRYKRGHPERMHCSDGIGKGNMTSIGVEICFCEYYVKVKFL